MIKNIIVDKKKLSRSYEGSLVSAFIRSLFLSAKRDFCFETVMSHYSKIEEIKEAKTLGFKTYLYFVCIDDPEINVSRVENRVKKGGHDVPKTDIEKRYPKTLQNLIKAIETCDKCYLFDNSGDTIKLISKISKMGLTIEVEPKELPNWFINYVLPYYEV